MTQRPDNNHAARRNLPLAFHLHRGAERHRAQRDAAAVVLATIIVAVISVNLELGERLESWIRNNEYYQFDEIRSVLLFFVIALLWFAYRRYRDTQYALRENRRLTRQTLTAQESERKFLARELHDETGQYLNAIKIDAVALTQQALPAQVHAVNGIVRNTDHVYAVIGRMIRRLRPAGLDELGLALALDGLIDEWRQRLTAIDFSLTIDATMPLLDDDHNLALYRIVQEGLTNAIKHGAPSRIVVALQQSGEQIYVMVQNDGTASEVTQGNGLGLIGIRERVHALAGSMTAKPLNDGGFLLQVYLPASAPDLS